jgi:hypothetical protein
MAGIVPYVIWAAVIITGLSIVAIVLFGIRNMTYGKMDVVTTTLLAVPFVLFGVLGFVVMDTWAEAAVLTFLILLVLTAGSLLLSSIRGLIGM